MSGLFSESQKETLEHQLETWACIYQQQTTEFVIIFKKKTKKKQDCDLKQDYYFFLQLHYSSAQKKKSFNVLSNKHKTIFTQTSNGLS